MAKSKKQKVHALKKELIKASLEREQEWKCLGTDLAVRGCALMETVKSKKSTLKTE